MLFERETGTFVLASRFFRVWKYLYGKRKKKNIMKYLHLFQTKAQHDAEYNGSDYMEPWVGYVNDGSNLVTYNKSVFAQKYLTTTAIDDTVFTIAFVKDSIANIYLTSSMRESFSYSIDNGETWETFETPNDTFEGVAIETPLIRSGEKVLWKGIGLQNYTSGPLGGGYSHFVSTGRFDVCGNIMSLAYGDDFEGEKDLSNMIGAFGNFFANCQYLVSAKNMVLPATTLAASACTFMFSGCTSLGTAPELPATTLDRYCYYGMFYGCTSLTKAPALPATTLNEGTYKNMFSNCTSLATAPELPATTFGVSAYTGMFSNCTSLATAPELPSTALADYCYGYMFNGCSSLTTPPKLSATTLADYCYWGMFNGCSSLTTPPELPATTLRLYCYRNMFYNCTSLATAPVLSATTLGMSCYDSMFAGCSSLTAAPALPATTLVSGCYATMFSGCTNLNYIKAMFTTTPTTAYTANWVSGVASSGTFVKNTSATWTTTGPNGIPTGWTVETASS